MKGRSRLDAFVYECQAVINITEGEMEKASNASKHRLSSRLNSQQSFDSPGTGMESSSPSKTEKHGKVATYILHDDDKYQAEIDMFLARFDLLLLLHPRYYASPCSVQRRYRSSRKQYDSTEVLGDERPNGRRSTLAHSLFYTAVERESIQLHRNT